MATKASDYSSASIKESEAVDTLEKAEVLLDQMMADANKRNADLEMHITVKR